MLAVTWTEEKSSTKNRRSFIRRIGFGPIVILVLCVGSSGALVAALLLSSLFEF